MAFADKHQMLRVGFDDNFSEFSFDTDPVRHAGKVLKLLDFKYAQGRRLSLTSNPRQCLKSLEISKETFYVF